MGKASRSPKIIAAKYDGTREPGQTGNKPGNLSAICSKVMVSPNPGAVNLEILQFRAAYQNGLGRGPKPYISLGTKFPGKRRVLVEGLSNVDLP
jgi:hypothetical protein